MDQGIHRAAQRTRARTEKIIAQDPDVCLDILEPLFKEISSSLLNWTKADADLYGVRDNPRFKALVAAVEARPAAEGGRA